MTSFTGLPAYRLAGFTKEFDMNPSKPNDPTPPAPGCTAASENTLLPAKASKKTPQLHPDQTGAQYGGYGHADNSFGRDAGSSSEEGGQGGEEPAADSRSAPKPAKDASQQNPARVKKPD